MSESPELVAEIGAGAGALTAGTETEAQKRRRLRQERILNRGNDRLSRIKSTFSQAQEESDKAELGMAGGHELKTAEGTPVEHTSGISIDAINEAAIDNGSSQPRRRAGNLARKARQEAEEAAAAAEFEGTAAEAPVEERTLRSSRLRPTVATADTNSDALHDNVNATISDPAAAAVAAAAGGGTGLREFLAGRRFSAVGLSRAFVKLVPVVGVYMFGVSREARYEQLVGESAEDVRSKWANLLRARPDGRLEEWANGNYILWYLLMLELVIYVAYFLIGGNGSGQRTAPSRSLSSSLLAQIPGVPAWSLVALSAGSRLLDSLSILLFLTALSITMKSSTP
ncbi:hypothetical protein BX661DRAFT_181479 [Kickxella alabastrina]|uniref:uncharacterized protein n=1 Tax=Kickxella alabastrina TaxID=61397 RepID=UPI00221EF1A8|nr:uncharacterized protein BX661DRAFT_181479 [Kickxella alabastrina]KAI7829167.1 hypothetical protein BX661DRAFT_181479 [Kickxella alabastrina]